MKPEFGKGFDESTLRKMRKFYSLFPIWDSLSPELSRTHYRNAHALRAQLTWTHLRRSQIAENEGCSNGI